MEQKISQSKKLTDWRWQAVQTKNREFDGVFYTGVLTTGIFCRPSCPAKIPKRENVVFFANPDAAEQAGFRACLRCKPKREYFPGAGAALFMRAFEVLQTDETEVSTIEELSHQLDISPGHLQKTFKTVLGLSPKEVMDMMRIAKFKQEVKNTDVTTSLYKSGFGSSRSLYEKADANLGMTPATYKKGGKDMKINYTIADSSLGKMLVAATEKGICSVKFGDTEDELTDNLHEEFAAAKIKSADEFLQKAVREILRHLAGEQKIFDLPLDLQATAFQMRVWAELRKIPYGETCSYKQIAEAIEKPKAIRAVASACAANPTALLTPCHRVIASDGKLSGYRWGVERKAKLLEQESINK